MKRYPDWEARLRAYLEPLRARPFAWGRHDCCTFAGGAVEAMTGEDPMAEFRGRYRSAAGASRALRAIGAGTLEATITAKLGAPVAPGLAQRGDVVMLDPAPWAEDVGALGIWLGSVAVMVGAEGSNEGLVTMPRAALARAWRVPMT